jgi:hypothetical protein
VGDTTGGASTVSRRDLIRRASVAGAVAWTAPVIIDSMASPAAASSGCGQCSEPSGIRIVPTDGTGENGEFECGEISFKDTCPVIQQWIESANRGTPPPWDGTCPPKGSISIEVVDVRRVTWRVVLPTGCTIATDAERRLLAGIGGFCDDATIEPRAGECSSEYLVSAPKDTLPFLDLVYCCSK